MINAQTIPPKTYIANPSKYPNVVIMTSDEYARQKDLFETLQAIRESEEDYAAGRFFSSMEKSNRITQSARSKKDLNGIFEYHVVKDPQYATETIKAIESAVEMLAYFAPLGNFDIDIQKPYLLVEPYRVYYTFDQDHIHGIGKRDKIYK